MQLCNFGSGPQLNEENGRESAALGAGLKLAIKAERNTRSALQRSREKTAHRCRFAVGSRIGNPCHENASARFRGSERRQCAGLKRVGWKAGATLRNPKEREFGRLLTCAALILREVQV